MLLCLLCCEAKSGKELGLERDPLLRVVHTCVSHYALVTDNDPPSAYGWVPWRWGTRDLRDWLVPGGGGWVKDEDGNLSSVRNDGRKLRLIVLNTDDATGILDADRGPRNRNKKGILHQRAMRDPKAWLPGLPNPFEQPAHDVWYLCLFIDGEHVRAELSRPLRIEGGFIVEWQERILLVGKGEWDSLEFDGQDGDTGPDFEINVRRKK